MTDADGMAGMGILSKNMTINRGKSKKDLSQISISDLRSGMFVQVFLYSKCIGLSPASSESGQTLASQDANPANALTLNYNLKYGQKELSWTEVDCQPLHKAKEIKLEYLLGQSDQTVTITISAHLKSTSKVSFTMSTLGEESLKDSVVENGPNAEDRMFEVSAEFELHRVMQHTLKFRPTKPNRVLH